MESLYLFTILLAVPLLLVVIVSVLTEFILDGGYFGDQNINYISSYLSLCIS